MNSREEFGSVDLNILVRFRSTLFPTPFKDKTFFVKQSQEWEKLQFLLYLSWIKWMLGKAVSI